MTPALKLERLKQIHSERAAEILRVASIPEVPLKRKQHLYSCLNNLCRLSARLFGDLSAEPGNHDLLDEAAKIDAALLELRRRVGSMMPTRGQLAA
ncbi:hypothetical protein [Hoeflea sp.]|uniref:hypothetical protein n=1 Tax=Hoeflea sp. TaxID=1940281 RepID=UPI003BB0B1C4